MHVHALVRNLRRVYLRTRRRYASIGAYQMSWLMPITLPHAALVVEDRWSSVFKLERVRPSVVAEGLAEVQIRFPTIPIALLTSGQTSPVR